VEYFKGPCNDEDKFIWVIDEISNNVQTSDGRKFLNYKNEKLSLSDKPDDWSGLKVDDVEEEYERLDTAEIVNVSMMLEKNAHVPREQMQITKDMMVKCPELNF